MLATLSILPAYRGLGVMARGVIDYCLPGTWYSPLSTYLSSFITFLAYRSECDYYRRTTVSATDTFVII